VDAICTAEVRIYDSNHDDANLNSGVPPKFKQYDLSIVDIRYLWWTSFMLSEHEHAL